MNEGRTVFAQLMDFLPKYEFDKCVHRYQGNFPGSLPLCLRAVPGYGFCTVDVAREPARYRNVFARPRAQALSQRHPPSGRSQHVGRRQRTPRLARLFADFAQVLIQEACRLYAGEALALALTRDIYALDSTTIDLCLSLFPWARFRRSKGGIKLHTLFKLRGSFPTVVVLTAARVHDVNFLDQLSYEPGCFYIMDKAYVDFQRLFRLHQSGAFFVTRPFRSFCARRLYSRPVDKSCGLLFDQTVLLIHFYAHKAYPEAMRRVGFRDPQTGRKFVFLSNNFIEPALTITQLYRCRWQVELFFKWIKQHLRIKAFYGVSENAVRTQIWIAMSIYLLVAIVKKRLHLDASLYTILQISSVTLFEKTPISQALAQHWPCSEEPNIQNQQCLPGF